MSVENKIESVDTGVLDTTFLLASLREDYENDNLFLDQERISDIICSLNTEETQKICTIFENAFNLNNSLQA